VALCNVYATGGWQTWKTQTKTVTLPQGTYRMRIFISKKEFNMNWISLTNPTGITDMQATMLNTFPNPCEDHLYVNTQGMSGHGNIIIHNTTGKNVLSQKYVLGDIINIPVAQLPAGMYILTLKAGRNLLTQKIIVR
ncbi:MAG: T9SS type A sorting domain-containing protein, partial [Bacteroidaceae bacterium]|nr:T9SS type A sorting domain-containing protein [Bacteroidaceae bacterium]